jgi:chromosomal replication initiator protein
MELNALWDTLLYALRVRLADPRAVDVWIDRCRPIRLADDLEVGLPNRYYLDWIRENYLPDMEREASGILGRPLAIRLVPQDAPEAPVTPAEPEPDVPTDDAQSGLNARQTFESFVIGECNRFAHGAAAHVAENPSKAYNPLYIYGGSGLGKTHLMNAIGNAVAGTERVLYTTAEDFMNEMINGLRYKNLEDFREKYRRGATVLLVDDIQFLSGKDRTQEEFFHTFNALLAAGRQVVLTSDVPPKDIDKLMPRLRTRFEGGLLADLQAPDPETLVAILRRKADAMAITVPEDVAHAIAMQVQGNVRELEGILLRLSAQRSFYGEPVTTALAERALPEIFAPRAPDVTVPQIIEAVARLHNIRAAEIIGGKRTRNLIRPRQIAMYLARRHTTLSFPELGREFGDRDHSTIQHGAKKIEAEVQQDADLAYKVRLIEGELRLRPNL